MNPAPTPLVRISRSVALALLLAVPAHAAGPAGTWTPFAIPSPSVTPSPRNHVAGIYDPNTSSLLINGGIPFQADTWAFPLGGPGGWTQRITLGTSFQRWGHAAVYDPVRNRMILMGGAGSGGDLNLAVALNLGGSPQIWSVLSPVGSLPAPRHSHFMIYDPVRDRLILFGGVQSGSPQQFFNDVWALDLSGTLQWTQLTPAGSPPSARSMVEAVYDPVRDRIVLFGGWNGTSDLGDLWQLSLSGTPTWSPLVASGSSPSPRADGGAVYDPVNDRIVFFGGDEAGTLKNDVRALSLAGTPAWSLLSPSGAPPSPRSGCLTIRDPASSRMIVFGGFDGDNATDIWSLSLGAGSETWSQVFSPTSAFAPNCAYQMAHDSARDRQVLFGGQVSTSSTPFSRQTWLWQLGPTPTFTRLLTAHAPSARAETGAAYDVANDRVLMFGGYDGNFLDELWQLNFSGGTPDWTLVPALGPGPSPRIWTSQVIDPVRQRLLVFGGHPNALNDLWEMPLSGPPQWSRLFPSGGLPPARWGHSAVYDPTRDRMLVFGGFTNTDMNDLWALEFTPTLRWVQVFPLGTPPAPRRVATMVYDSSRGRMLLFGGGSDAAGFFGDVWELDCASDRWTKLRDTSLPGVRDQLTASYDPLMDRLAVFGGLGQGSQLLGDAWFLEFGQPTAAEISQVRGERTPEGVRLLWELGAASDAPTGIDRSLDGGVSWSRVAPAFPDANRQVMWTDAGVPADVRVGYRLTFAGTGSPAAGEVWVDASPLAFAFHGVGPNPAVGAAWMSFALPNRRAATLDLFDLAGRNVLHRDLGTLGPGDHRIAFDGLGRLSPGVYQVRLASGRDRANARITIVR